MTAGKLAVLILGCVAVTGGWVSSVHAQSCKDDTGCPKGFSCEVTGMGGCAVPTPAPQPARTPSCGDAGPCGAAPPADLPVPTCAPAEVRSCVPGPCMADANCADGMVCHARSTGTCSSAPIPPCFPGSKCPEVAPPVCTDTVEHICIPRYLLPCEQTADCGDGFTCEPQSVCGCSGGSAGAPSAGTAGAPAATPPAPAQDAGAPEPAGDRAAPALPAPPAQPVLPPDCGCEPTKEKYCKVIEVACRADSDCPKTFTCKQSYPGTSASGPACIDPGNGNGDAGTCGSAAFVPPPADIYRCIPPYDGVDTGYGGKGEGTGYPTTPTTPGNPNPTTGGLPPVAQPVPGQAVDAGVPGDPGTGTPDGDNAGAAPSHVKACSVSNPGASTGAGSAALWTTLMSLAAAWAFTRRRR
jgi:hypothetical protein